jgi:hypothetical protein
VQQGDVVILNGDQPLSDLQEQLQEAEFPLDERTLIRGEWSLHYYAQFMELMKRRRPKLVIIDSLIGCAGGKAFDENKSEFAQPLYWLTRNNGVLYPATTILVIHHANKQGGFRGTSAIRDAVNEVWALKKPEGALLAEVGPAARVITIEKSRCGRGGTQLLMRMEDDLSFSIRDFTPEVNPDDTTPASHSDRVLQRLRTVFPRTLRQADLNSDPLLGGRVAATKKALQRLVKRGLIEAVDGVPGPRGSTVFHYRAVLVQSDTSTTRARGEAKKVSPSGHFPCAAVDRLGDTPPVEKEGVPQSESGSDGGGATGGHIPENDPPCPPVKGSRTKGSATGGHSGEYPHARGREASGSESDEAAPVAALDHAANLWE